MPKGMKGFQPGPRGPKKPSQGFQKGNTWGAKGRAAVKASVSVPIDHLAALFEFIGNEGSEKARELAMRLANGKQIKGPQAEFLRYHMKLLPYKAPQLQRTEITGAGGGPVEIKLSEEKKEQIKKALENL